MLSQMDIWHKVPDMTHRKKKEGHVGRRILDIHTWVDFFIVVSLELRGSLGEPFVGEETMMA